MAGFPMIAARQPTPTKLSGLRGSGERPKSPTFSEGLGLWMASSSSKSGSSTECAEATELGARVASVVRDSGLSTEQPVVFSPQCPGSFRLLSRRKPNAELCSGDRRTQSSNKTLGRLDLYWQRLPPLLPPLSPALAPLILRTGAGSGRRLLLAPKFKWSSAVTGWRQCLLCCSCSSPVMAGTVN